MKLAQFFAIAALLILAASSFTPAAFGQALQGLFSDKDCEAVPEILGDWTGISDVGGTWTLRKLGDRKYRLVQQTEESDSGNRGAFDICIAHLSGYLFFDAIFQELRPDGKEVLASDESDFWIPLHIIGRLDVEKNALHFRLLDDGWLQEALKSGRVHLATVQYDGDTLLIAPRKELQEFAVRFAKDPKAFAYEESFERAPTEGDGRRTDGQRGHN